MRKLFLAVIVLSLVSNHYVYAETTTTSTVTCVDTVVPVVTENSPIEGDTTTTTTTTTNCTTTVVTTVTTPESTTTTTSVSENLTDSGNILTNSTFGSGTTFSGAGWNIDDAHTHPAYPNAGGASSPSVGGSVAAEDDTVITQTVSSVKTKTGMSDAEIKNGFRSTLKARIWFWNNYGQTVWLRQRVTDSSGNTTTQTRTITESGCGYNNCGEWTNYDDTYIQGSNNSDDFAIEVEVSNDVHNYTGHGHLGPDIDDIELNIHHNEITTTTNTVAASTSSSTASTVATTVAVVEEIEYCWQKTPSTCADQPGLDEITEDVDTAIEEIAIEEITVIEVVNLDVVEIEIIEVTMDEAIEMELSFEPEQSFEEAFTSIIEEAGMEQEFSDALAEENITEEQFFEEVQDVMTEEMGTPEVTMETPTVIEDAPVVEEAPIEETPMIEEAPVEEAPIEEEMPIEEAPVEEEMPIEEAPVEEEMPVEEEAPIEEAPVEEEATLEESEPTTETEEETVEENNEEATEEESSGDVEESVDSDEATEESTESSNGGDDGEATENTEETEVEEQEETDADTEVEEDGEVEVDEAEVEAQVEEIQASIERVIARVQANLTRIDLKLKATSFVLAQAMIDMQPDLDEYTSQVLYDPVQLPDNNDWYAESTILEVYGRSVYQDRTLGEYADNDPMAVYEEEINTTNENISRLEAELQELENELNE